MSEFLLTDAIYDEITSAIESASSFANIGKFDVETQLQIKDGDVWRDADLDEYRAQKNASPYLARGTFVLKVETEFNPGGKDYKRFLRFDDTAFKPNNYEGEPFKPNFEAVFVPSLKNVFGNKYEKPFSSINAMIGKYVDMRDVTAVPSYRDNILDEAGEYSCEWGTPSVNAIFDSRESAYAAYQGLSGGDSGTDSSEDVKSSKYAQDDIDNVEALLADGEKPKAIADDLELPLKDVLAIKKMLSS